MGKGTFGWKQCEGVVVVEVLVDNGDLNGGWMPTGIGAELDIKACRFWSWVIKLAKMLFVETSKTCWYSDTFCRCC